MNSDVPKLFSTDTNSLSFLLTSRTKLSGFIGIVDILIVAHLGPAIHILY